MEIKCQLDATDEFLLQILLLAQHVSGTIMPIIRSSRLPVRYNYTVTYGCVPEDEPSGSNHADDIVKFKTLVLKR